MKTAACYIRVSTDMQTEYSPDSQLRLIRDYAKKHDFLLYEEHIYADEGISGRKADKRPEFQKMLRAAKNKAFEAILIYNTSRFARNHEESVVYRAMLKRQGIELISITQPNIDEKTDLLMNALYAVMDERFSLDLSENVRRGMIEKAMRGECISSVPYGYKIVESKKPPIIIEEEAALVKSMFNQYLNENKSVFSIAKGLNIQGILSPMGKMWTRERVDKILSNPFYCGYIRYNMKDANKRPKDKSEWVIQKGNHEALISEDVHKQIVERMSKNRRNAKPTHQKVHWLSGLIKCANCGSPLNIVRSSKGNKETLFLRCRGYAFGKCEVTQHISVEIAEKYLVENLERTVNYPELALYERASESTNETQKQELLVSLARAQKKMDRIKESYANGVDTLDEYKQNKEKINAEINSISEQISEIDKLSTGKLTKKMQEQLIASTKDVLELIKSNASLEEKTEAARNVISKIIFDKKADEFTVYFYI